MSKRRSTPKLTSDCCRILLTRSIPLCQKELFPLLRERYARLVISMAGKDPQKLCYGEDLGGRRPNMSIPSDASSGLNSFHRVDPLF